MLISKTILNCSQSFPGFLGGLWLGHFPRTGGVSLQLRPQNCLTVGRWRCGTVTPTEVRWSGTRAFRFTAFWTSCKNNLVASDTRRCCTMHTWCTPTCLWMTWGCSTCCEDSRNGISKIECYELCSWSLLSFAEQSSKYLAFTCFQIFQVIPMSAE